tara:strand:- start:36849 stop:38087 length:1239 start_codon:yes stop_codon:yes gene_type:complete
MLIGGIGDDFTGSGDLANTLAREGMHVVQYCGIPAGPADPSVEAGVVSLKSRTIPAGDAVAQSLAALDWLMSQGCQQIVFKYCSTFDSTAEGNIGPVAAALADRMNAKHIIVCPSFPAAGRTVYQGHLFVADQLLNESGMKDHPLTPMTDPDIRRWLALQTDIPVGHIPHTVVRSGAEAIKASIGEVAGRRLLVVDATNDDDLRQIGHAAADLKLVTGGSGVAMGLPANFRAAGALGKGQHHWRGSNGPCVILAGSCSQMTQAQVAAHLETNPGLFIEIDAVLDGRTTAKTVTEWLLAQDGLPIAYSTTDPQTIRDAQARHGRDRAAGAIEGLFAAVALEIVAKGVTRLITAGGETSGAVIEALAPEALEIGPEIAAGVPALMSGPLAIALKSGNFGAADFFETAARKLSGS